MNNNSEIPEVLYHYTSQEGLLGIIQNKQLWATNTLFLNDSMEIIHAIELVEENVNRYCKDRGVSQEETEFLDAFRKKLKRIFYSSGYQKYGGVYTCSFSEEGDLLSQWRGYCPDGNGFSIGFNFPSGLGYLVEGQSFELVKCEYGERRQLEMINAFFDTARKHFQENKSETVLDDKVWNDFFLLAPVLKSREFSEEKEWRLISQPFPVEFGVDYRVGKSMLIPYVKINLTTHCDERINSIPEIYIGPTTHAELSFISLSGFLKKEDVHEKGRGKESHSKVRLSKIPYRI